LAIDHPTISCDDLEMKLRSAETPVITRIENGKVLIDLRTVQEGEEDRLIETLVSVLS